MSRKPTAEQQARFQRFCTAMIEDIRRSAFKAALVAGYSRRMAKSKSYLLARRAFQKPGFRRAYRKAQEAHAARVNAEY